FPADELLERLLLEERVAVARNDPPTVRYRPDEREIALLDHAAAVAVCEAEQPILGRPVLETGLGAGRALGIAVPLIAEVEIPRVAEPDRELGDVVGRVRVDRRHARQRNALRAEIAGLADGGREALHAGALLDEPCRDAEAELVRVADPVRPDE